MKTVLTRTAAVAAFALLAACGSADDANAPAEADTVEMPADEVMAQPGMDADPAVDPAIVDDVAQIEADDAAAAEEATAAEQSAESAADAAADLEAALNAE